MDDKRPARGILPPSADVALQPLQDDCAVVAETVKTQDLDAWLAGLLVPGPLQGWHWAVWGLVADVLAVPWKVSEPTLGLLRLQWWRDTLGEDAPVRHPLDRLVHDALQQAPGLQAALSTFVEAAADWLAEPLGEQGAEDWLKAAETLALALAIADDGRDLPSGKAQDRLRALGRAWGCAMLLRRAPHVRRNGLPLLRNRAVAAHLLKEGTAAAKAARQGRAMRLSRARKALLRAFALSPLWLKAAAQALQENRQGSALAAIPPLVPPSQAARQWRLLRIRLTGRLV